jgi:predicted enzyme related to lactoylglutathione lyase
VKAEYRHTNIIARDWRILAAFYERVFGCMRVGPERDISAPWLEKGTGVTGAALQGAHLLLPGGGEDGPTLEIYQYSRSEPGPGPAANREGIAHIAFEVDDIKEAVSRVLEHGGKRLGEITRAEVEGAGAFTFVYVTDPEDNIVELQAPGS